MARVYPLEHTGVYKAIKSPHGSADFSGGFFPAVSGKPRPVNHLGMPQPNHLY